MFFIVQKFFFHGVETQKKIILSLLGFLYKNLSSNWRVRRNFYYFISVDKGQEESYGKKSILKKNEGLMIKVSINAWLKIP